jgi:hypothetical protein
MMINQVTFQAIGFARYMCRTMRDAAKFIADPAVFAEVRMLNGRRRKIKYLRRGNEPPPG